MKYKTFEKFQTVIWILFIIYCFALFIFIVLKGSSFLGIKWVDAGKTVVMPDGVLFDSIPVGFFILFLLVKYVVWVDFYYYEKGYYIWLSYSDCQKFSMISNKIRLIEKHYIYTSIAKDLFSFSRNYVVLFSFPDWLRFRFDVFVDNWQKNIRHTDEISCRDRQTLIMFLEDMQGEIDKVKAQAAKEFETGKEIFAKVVDKSSKP